MLIYYVFRSLSRALKDKSSCISALGVGLSVGMVNLFTCAIFGNVFGTTYGVPQAMTALGCLAAYEQIRSSHFMTNGGIRRASPIAKPA